MKILHYTPAYPPAWKTGGPVRSVSQICEGLAALGHDVTVLTTNVELEDNLDIVPGRPQERNGVKVTYFSMKKGLSGIRSADLEATVRKRVAEFDLVHVTGVWQPTSMAACRAAKKAGVPYVISPRGALGDYSWTQKPWKKIPYWWLYERKNCCDAAVMHYTTIMEEMECRRFKLPGQSALIPNSVGLGFWTYDADAAQRWRSKNNIPVDMKLLLNAGRLHHKKGLDLLPEALAGLTDSNWKMIFVGSDDDGTKGALITEFNKRGLSERILFIDTIPPEELRALYSAADLFLLPSRHENFGNVVIEALSCRCPVIISDHVGVAEDLTEYEEVTVLANDSAQWSAVIQHMSAEKITESVVNSLNENYSLNAVVSAFENVYRRLSK